MRTIKNTWVSLILAIAFLSLSHTSEASNEDAFEKLSGKLEEAIEKRNFQEARMAIEKLLPLMKSTLKEEKKLIHELKKAEKPELDPELLQKKYDRKVELYDSLKKLVNISPAALRVKAKLVKEEVNEFIELY